MMRLHQLRSTGLLGGESEPLPADVAEDIETQVEWFGLTSGTILFRQGDVSTDMYVLLDGRLGVLADKGLGGQLVEYVEVGSLVGEMAVITGEARSATVTAFRDSELLRVPMALAQRLIGSSPTFSGVIMRQLAHRLRATTHRPTASRTAQAVAIVPLASGMFDPAAAGLIRKAFVSVSRDVAFVDSQQTGAPEADRDLTIYLSADSGSPGSRRSIRQSDRVLFFATAGEAPRREAIAEIEAAKRLERQADLVLVHPVATRHPSGASAWLDLFGPDHIFHLRAGDLADHQRIARLATGRAVGVVLSGGGARGFAHVGAIRALYESGVPIDLICGASMGALIAATAAYDVDVEEVSRKIHYGSVANNALGDYTLPILALARGRRMSRLLRHAFGDARIEDTWKTFFCVSSNLSTGETRVHQTGLIWQALRASSAIPGVVPPVIEGQDVLVDGGVMNNFPADIMASFARGRVIGVEVSARMPFHALESDIENRSLAWLLGPGRGKVPNIVKLLMRAGTIGSNVQSDASKAAADLLIVPDLAQVDMLSFDKFDVAVKAGYHATMKALADCGWR